MSLVHAASFRPLILGSHAVHERHVRLAVHCACFIVSSEAPGNNEICRLRRNLHHFAETHFTSETHAAVNDKEPVRMTGRYIKATVD